jgi:hypothetical protein
VILAVLVCVGSVLSCVAVHLGFLLSAYRLLAPRFQTLHRATVGLLVLGAILAHLVEISLFGAGYTLLAPTGDWLDVWYHSAAAYTSLGDSQVGAPEWRLMTAVEALTGLVLVTWTASFTFLVMQKNWGHDDSPPEHAGRKGLGPARLSVSNHGPISPEPCSRRITCVPVQEDPGPD